MLGAWTLWWLITSADRHRSTPFPFPVVVCSLNLSFLHLVYPNWSKKKTWCLHAHSQYTVCEPHQNSSCNTRMCNLTAVSVAMEERSTLSGPQCAPFSHLLFQNTSCDRTALTTRKLFAFFHFSTRNPEWWSFLTSHSTKSVKSKQNQCMLTWFHVSSCKLTISMRLVHTSQW